MNTPKTKATAIMEADPMVVPLQHGDWYQYAKVAIARSASVLQM